MCIEWGPRSENRAVSEEEGSLSCCAAEVLCLGAHAAGAGGDGPGVFVCGCSGVAGVWGVARGSEVLGCGGDQPRQCEPAGEGVDARRTAVRGSEAARVV